MKINKDQKNANPVEYIPHETIIGADNLNWIQDKLQDTEDSLENHKNNTAVHVTSAEKNSWIKYPEKSGIDEKDKFLQKTKTGVQWAAGPTDYGQLINKPYINGTELAGNITMEINDTSLIGKHYSSDLGLATSEQLNTKITNPSGGSPGYVLKKKDDGVEWAPESGGGGEPSQYLKMAALSGDSLVLTKKDDTTVTYTPPSISDTMIDQICQ